MSTKIRIINDKTGDVKFISPFVAQQTDELKRRGYRIEDLNSKDNHVVYDNGNDTVNIPAVENLHIEEERLIEDVIENSELGALEDGLVSEEPAQQTRKKPGPKPKTQVTE